MKGIDHVTPFTDNRKFVLEMYYSSRQVLLQTPITIVSASFFSEPQARTVLTSNAFRADTFLTFPLTV
jgi:hypothetical protein